MINRPTQWYDAYIFDLDGTVYLGDVALPTAVQTITHLRDMGKRTVFLSNNPTRIREEYAARLTRLGLPDDGRPSGDGCVVGLAGGHGGGAHPYRGDGCGSVGGVRHPPDLCGAVFGGIVANNQ